MRARPARAPAAARRRRRSAAGSRRACRRASRPPAAPRRRRRSPARARPSGSSPSPPDRVRAAAPAAISAAIFGTTDDGAVFASFDQPPVSRMLTKRIGRSSQARRALGLGVELEEEPALLRAGDEQFVAALGRTLEGAGLAPAEQRVLRSAARRRRQGRGPGRCGPAPAGRAASSGCSRRAVSSSVGISGASSPGRRRATVAEPAPRRQRGHSLGARPCAPLRCLAPRRRTGAGASTASSGAAWPSGIGSGLP